MTTTQVTTTQVALTDLTDVNLDHFAAAEVQLLVTVQLAALTDLTDVNLNYVPAKQLSSTDAHYLVIAADTDATYSLLHHEPPSTTQKYIQSEYFSLPFSCKIAS